MIHNQFNNCQNVNVTNIHVTQEAPSRTEQNENKQLTHSKLDVMLAESLEFAVTKALPALLFDVAVPVLKIGAIFLLKTANIIILEVLAPVCKGTLKGIVHAVNTAKQHQLEAKKVAKLLPPASQEEQQLVKTHILQLQDGTEIYDTK